MDSRLEELNKSLDNFNEFKLKSEEERRKYYELPNKAAHLVNLVNFLGVTVDFINGDYNYGKMAFRLALTSGAVFATTMFYVNKRINDEAMEDELSDKVKDDFLAVQNDKELSKQYGVEYRNIKSINGIMIQDLEGEEREKVLTKIYERKKTK
jgi:hypothetical protein